MTKPKLRRGVAAAAGLAGLLGASLVGPGASAAFAASESYEIAFQANNGTLYSYTSALVGTSTTLGMEPGTNPASVELSDGTFESAFEANNDDLYLHKWSGVNASTTLGMYPGTSPALAALPTSAGWVAAFEANNGDLYIYTSAGTGTNTKLGMEAGTSPAIAVQPSGKWEVAFQTNTGVLDTYDSVGNSQITTDGMASGTSPSITPLLDGSYEVAFEANNDNLSAYHTGGSTDNTNLGMDAGTDPSISIQPTGKWEVAFQSNAHTLYTYDSVGNNQGTSDGMAPGTSPSLTPEADNSYEVAFEANNDNLGIYHTGGTTAATSLGMSAGTSPTAAISAPTPPTTPTGCAAAESCSPQTFAEALLGYINAPVTAANEYTIEMWADEQGVAAACADQTANASTWPAAWASGDNTAAGNPLATTLTEPGSYSQPANTADVQEYVTGSGETCWEWGVIATADTLLYTDSPNPDEYGQIVADLDSPSSNEVTQCDDVSAAVAASAWGGSFAPECAAGD